MKGTHGTVKGIERFISNTACKEIKIKPIGNSMRICVDGEIISAGKTKFEILHDAYRFVVPYPAQ
jgi:diacylglycerol kinase family enzyme